MSDKQNECKKPNENVGFFDRFFNCNDDDICHLFIDELRLPKDMSKLLKSFYIDKTEAKIIADNLNIDERTVRSRLACARDLCMLKMVFWLSNYFANLKKLS
jgi:hypothetical protein